MAHERWRTFDDISYINRERGRRWHSDGAEGEAAWTKGDWGCALAGEAGELCNLIKKMRRIETGTDISRDDERDIEALIQKAKGEIADIFLYCDLVLSQLDPLANMYHVISHKFNATSRDYGFPERM